MDRNLNTNLKKGHILKQITTLLLLCLLFSPLTFAAPQAATAETTLPQPAVIQESTATMGSSATTNANSQPEADASAKENVPVVTPTATTPTVTKQTPWSTIKELFGFSVPPTDPHSVSVNNNDLADYRLSPGDGVEISVWKEDGLQQQTYLISPDGTIIFPLIGTLTATGKTITELKNIITTKLSDYISEPSVTVKLMGNQGNTIFVIGKVGKPGQYYSSRKIDVLQALSLAGGLSVYASESSISILRRIGNEIKVFPFDYSNVIKGENLEENILLEPGDTVTVP